jgi:tetratricopeptide (TPR) repeat protein
MPLLIDICVKLNDQPAALRALDRATAKISRVARMNPEFFEIWISLVKCAVAVKDYEQAREFIQEGYRSIKNPDNRRRIMQMASLISLQNADDFVDLEDEQQFRLRLFALCKAIQSNPRDTRIYRRLMDYVDIDRGGPIRDAWLRNSILGCPIPGVIHIILGMRELSRDNIVQGQSHWDIAQQQFGTTEFVVHRLIATAVQQDDKYVEGQIISKAIEMFPEQYMLYETRGALKKGEGRYEDALKDFKIVVEKVPERISVHKHLSDCYEKLGQAELAKIHKNRVEEILDQLDQRNREEYEKLLEQL